MLVLCILAIVDGGNIGAPKGVEPLAIGLIIMAIGVSMGLNCGYPLNPARDLGPRLFTAVAGWGMEVFRYTVEQEKTNSEVCLICLQHLFLRRVGTDVAAKFRRNLRRNFLFTFLHFNKLMAKLQLRDLNLFHRLL